MTTALRKTLVFGLDGFDFTYAERLATAGRMPWFASMLQSGALVTTSNPVLPGSEWVSAACGVSPAQHGYTHTSQLRVGTYENVETNASVVRCDPFYTTIASAGLKTIIVDLCVDRPRPASNLVQVIDWATEFKLWRYATTPASVAKLVQEVGNHPLTNYPGTDPSEANLKHLNEKLGVGVRVKGRLMRALMAAHPDWQVFFAGFCEVHKAGHFFWQYQDPAHPGYAGDAHPLAGAMAASYELLDGQMQETAAAAGPHINIVIAADRGMRANLRGDHLIETVLMRLGLLATGNPTQTTSMMAESQHVPVVRSSTTLARRLKERVPVSLRPVLRRFIGKERYDWRSTKVFPLPDVGNSYMRVNLRGREPNGTVRPDEYAQLLASLEVEFLSLVNPLTGTCPVQEVVYPQRAFTGPVQNWLADIGIVWRGDAPVTAMTSSAIGRVDGSHAEQRSGNHTEEGGLLFRGPDFRAGSVRNGDLRELAPTLLALHNLPIPENIECDPATELKR